MDAGVGGPPTLLSVTVPVHGTMELTWRNPAAGCDSVQVNRRFGAGAYAVVKTLSGAATSTQDEPGHTNGTYCYTVACVSGATPSEPSNEKCATQ